MKVKANKRGFTLVELVVVIAILAIIAAIAIPCLINIIDSTTASSGEAQAQTLNQECQNAYNEIKAGTINNTMSKNADGTAVSFAAIKNSGITTRKNAARNAKVSDIAKYYGLNINKCKLLPIVLSMGIFVCHILKYNNGSPSIDIIPKYVITLIFHK